MCVKSLLTEETLMRLKQIECAAYQSNQNLLALQDCEDWEEVALYCDCSLEELRVYLFKHGYLLCAEHQTELEIVDLASDGGFIDLRKPLRVLETYDKPLVMYCRESTSYPILKYMEMIGKMIITGDEAESYEGETFHEVHAVTCAAILREQLAPSISGEQEHSPEEER